MSDDPDTTNRPTRRHWSRRAVSLFTWLVALIVALVAGTWWALGTQLALDVFVQRVQDAANGQLTVEGAEGSLLSTIRVRRIAWQGETADAEAREMVLIWSPLDLVSRRFMVKGLGAQVISLHFKGSGTSSNGLPANLSVPLEIEVSNIGVQRLEWKTGDGDGHVTGVTFGYAGGTRGHEIKSLRFVTENGTLSGDAQVGAAAPFALTGALAFVGDGTYQGADARLTVGGTLERMSVDAKGSLRNAGVAVRATLAPFSSALLVSADVDARDVDIAQFAPALPATALTLNLSARPAGGGFTGTLSARNANAGPLDAGRVPVMSLASAFAWDGQVLVLRDANAELPGGGRAAGTVSISVAGTPVQLNLTLANVDLARIQTSFIATRLSGTVTGEVAQDRQVLRGDLRQDDLTASFAGSIVRRRLTLDRVRLQAGKGELAGHGTFDFDAPRAFDVAATATRFDPSRFVAMPAAQLDGTVAAHGTLSPRFDVTADVVLQKGSRFADLAAAGHARAHVTPGAAREVAVKASLGTANLSLDGSFGSPADGLAFELDVPHVEELKPLVARYAKVTLPGKSAGALHAKGKVSGEPGMPGLTLALEGRGLQWGADYRAATLDLAASAPADARGTNGGRLADRALSLKLGATGIRIAQRDVASLKATADGTLAQHKVTVAATAEDIDLAATLVGGVVEVKRPNVAAEHSWQGTLDTLVNRGAYAFHLEAPAKLALAHDRMEVGSARIAAANGRVDLGRLTVEDGRITSQGSFTGIAVAALARFGGVPLPFPSTLLIGGEWSLAATPRLNGTLGVRRESGDWYASDSAAAPQPELALGITTLELEGTFSEDALTAAAHFRSARAGTADATMTLAAGRVPGRLATDAPLAATLTANLATLRPLQPWLGTLAVMDGRVHLALSARGTLDNPQAGGTLAGDALRFDLPQYGVHLRDGVLRARLADRALLLEELSFVGGSGKFQAKGTLARAADANVANGAAKVEWQANDFAVVSRPDLQIVADGRGTLAIENGKLALAGSIEIDKGRVIYEPTRVGTLSDDVVIVGQPRAVVDAGRGDLPLALDVEVALGNDFRFSGEGLDTRLGGKVHVVTSPGGNINGRGIIYAIGGTYFVFGQRLDIDRGRLIFDGPLNNPALDVVALRKNLAVEAGVELTGTVRVPRVRLVSNPPVPDGEKLSWLLTGQGLDRANRADLAALSAASASLLGQGRKPITTQIANAVGLDDISVRDSGNAIAGGTSGQVVAFGKRISDRLTLVYEQGLSLANNALRIEYALSRSLTLRAEAGVVSSIGLYFRRSYE